MELETEKDNDNSALKKQQLEKKLDLMKEMQQYGQPPKELVGDQMNFFDMDAEGKAVLPNFPPGLLNDPDAAQNCSIM